MTDNKPRSRFIESREELRNWPYTIHQIDDTLDISLIEGRAKQILFHALTEENVIAFIGTGVSAAYGRMGWGPWRAAQLDVSENLAAAFTELCDVAIKHKKSWIELLESKDGLKNADHRKARRWLLHRQAQIGYAHDEVKKLFLAFKKAASDTGSFPGGEALPVEFEIARKLHDLVLEKRDIFIDPRSKSDTPSGKIKKWGSHLDTSQGAPKTALVKLKKLPNPKSGIEGKLDAYYRLATRPEGKITFETLAKVLLVDECAHAEWLLLDGLKRTGNLDGRLQRIKRRSKPIGTSWPKSERILMLSTSRT